MEGITMNRFVYGLLAAGMLALTPQVSRATDDLSRTVSNVWTRVREEGGRAWMVGRIKAAFADRKDIPGRLIRVRLKGDVVQLAGFVPDQSVSEAAEAIARDLAKPTEVVAFWAEDSSMGAEEPYKTHVGEKTDDAMLKAKVLVSLNSPAVSPQFKGAEILHVQVVQGAVVIYIVADEPSTFDLDPYVKPIAGVLSCTLHVVEAY
jgi:osmotically-inducible protein OsmY